MDVIERIVVEKRLSTGAALLGAAALYGSFGLLDLALFPAQSGLMLVIRGGVISYLVALVLLMWLAPRVYLRHSQWLLSMAMILAGGGIVWMSVLASGQPYGETYYAGLILVMCVQAVFAPLRWWLSAANSLLIVAAYNATLPESDLPLAVLLGNNFFLAGAALILAAGSYAEERNARLRFAHEDTIERQKQDIEVQKQRADALLHQILPDPIADRLMDGNQTIADGYSDVTVLFADLSGFTEYSSSVSPRGLVRVLNRVFSAFDDAAEELGVEKIKTIGDAYMAACGLPNEVEDHPERMVALALRMREEMALVREEFPGFVLDIRIGIHTGPCIAGVIGRQRLIYDLWGDTVNLASRMESTGMPGQIQVTEATWLRTRHAFRYEARHEVHVKGRGMMNAYLLQA